MPKKSRPPFVKHIVAIMVIFGILFIGFFGTIQALAYGDFSNPLTIALEMVIAALVVALLISAVGLWTMKPWARRAAIIAMIAVIVVGLPGLFALLLFYRSIRRLLKPETKLAFGELDEREARKLKLQQEIKTCKKCGASLNPIDDLVPETGELVCPKCGHRHKKFRKFTKKIK